MSDDHNIPCPACGFLTLEGAYGSYVICDLCGWEDDQVQLANPACGGGANSESLIEAQAVALTRYPLSVQLAQGATRDSRWRPLNETEKRIAESEREQHYWRNRGIVALDECYWMNALPSARRAAVALARAALAGSLDPLVAVQQLTRLRFSVGVPEDDADFLCFVAIESETDALPVGSERQFWSEDALQQLEPRIAEARCYAAEDGKDAFENVVRRFSEAG